MPTIFPHYGQSENKTHIEPNREREKRRGGASREVAAAILLMTGYSRELVNLQNLSYPTYFSRGSLLSDHLHLSVFRLVFAHSDGSSRKCIQASERILENEITTALIYSRMENIFSRCLTNIFHLMSVFKVRLNLNFILPIIQMLCFFFSHFFINNKMLNVDGLRVVDS
jgi:hypothetical protein